MPGTTNSDMLAAHEDRILRLESNLGNIGTDVTQATTKLDYISQQMSDSTKFVAEKFESIMNPLANDVKEISSKLDDHHDRLTKLEGHEAKRSARVDAVRKTLWALGLAVVGAGGKMLFDVLFKAAGVGGP